MWSQELEMKLMEQEAHYQTELSKAMARLRGIDSMVDTVANAGVCAGYCNGALCTEDLTVATPSR